MSAVKNKQVLSSVFYIISFILGGGITGLITGVLMSNGSGHPHIPDLSGLLIGSPIGVSVGFIIAMLTFRNCSIKQRLLYGILAFLFCIITVALLVLLADMGIFYLT